MGKAEIYSDIICLTNNMKRYSRREIELILINIKNKCVLELHKTSEYNSKVYHSNPYKKELKAIANSKIAIRKAFKSRHNWKKRQQTNTFILYFKAPDKEAHQNNKRESINNLKRITK